jgi:hypothetical protein
MPSRQATARMIESGPIPAVHGVVRWRFIGRAQWIFEEFRNTIAQQTLNRELRAMGYRKAASLNSFANEGREALVAKLILARLEPRAVHSLWPFARDRAAC